MRKIFKFIIGLFSASLLLLFGYLYSPWWPSQKCTESEFGQIEDIEVPLGYSRLVAADYADYLRQLPLAKPDEVVRRRDGELADTIIPYCFRVIDLPLLSRYEQCADVCIRLWAEYLFEERRFADIHFDDTKYQTMTFVYGNRRSKFDEYLHRVFLLSNTESLIHEMPRRNIQDIQPGDIFVYDAKSRPDAHYGHAIMVADVAVDDVTGEKICMLVQGSTPACSIHILRNRRDSILSPWFRLEADSDTLDFGFARYHRDELRYFEPTHVYGDSVKKEAMEKLSARLIEAYPEQNLRYERGKIVFPDGYSLDFDDGKYKDYEDKLGNPDIEDMFSLSYDTLGEPGYLADAGRIRNEAFFKKMYGTTKKEVRQNLEPVEWFGQQVLFSKVNGASLQLKKVAEELSEHSELLPYLQSAGTFNWRKVRGADRMSAHSFGTAIDINTQYANYWAWDYPETDELKKISYANRIPIEIVHIFERHGFIWGGRWYHYDTMHFEYRPEILTKTVD